MDELHAEIMKEFIASLREADMAGYKITTGAADGTVIDVRDDSLTPEEVVKAMWTDDISFRAIAAADEPQEA